MGVQYVLVLWWGRGYDFVCIGFQVGWIVVLFWSEIVYGSKVEWEVIWIVCDVFVM